MMPNNFLSLLKEESPESSNMDTSTDCLQMTGSSQANSQVPNEGVTDIKHQRMAMTTLASNNMQPPRSGILNEIDPTFEPLPRGRCNTWPLLPEGFMENEEATRVDSSTTDTPRVQTGPTLADSTALPPKKNTSRRNPWGNMSYADLIAEAIVSSQERRATLSQIYDWMVQNIPYFKDKGDSNSSAGWKNSIRHNLSLHNRFMRMQNEGTGKSSWWVLNPDAKPGKSTRRRANTLESSRLDRKPGRVRKKGERKGIEPPPSPSLVEGMEYFPNSPTTVALHHPFQPSPPDVRPRLPSNASSCGSLTPIATSMESDMHDTQVPPISPGVVGWTPDYWSINPHIHAGHLPGHSHERYADHLVDSIGEGLKLGPRNELWANQHHSMLGLHGGPRDCLPLAPHQPQPHHHMNGFLNHSNIPHPRSNYDSYENFNGYMSPNAHCSPFYSHVKEKRLRPHPGPQQVNNLQPMPNSSHNISSSPRPFADPHFPPSCDQEMNHHQSSFSSPLILPPISQDSSKSSSFSSNHSPPSCQFSSSFETKKSESFDGDSIPSTSSGSVSSSNQQPQEETISESTTMLRVALSHREASSCLMNGGSHHYKQNGFGQHHVMVHGGPHGNSDFGDFDNIQEGLYCNVDEVIKQELEYEGDLNFDLEQSHSSGSYPYGHAYPHREGPSPQLRGSSGTVPVYSCSSISSSNPWVR